MILALDIGTSKLCALAYDPAADAVTAVRTVPNDTDIADLPAGRHAQDPRRIEARCRGLLRELLAEPAVDRAAVKAIAFSCQMHGLLLVNPDGQPLTSLVTWRDQGMADHVEPLNTADLAGPARTGCRLAAGYGALTLAHWAQARALPAQAVALSIADFVVASLCGILATEPTLAASWGLLDLVHSDWDASRVQQLSIPQAVLPALHPSAMPLGALTRAAQAGLDLPASVAVCAPVGDNQASVIGVAGWEPDICVLNLGTGGQVSLLRSDYAFDPALETRPLPFGGFLQVGASLCGGWSYAYLCNFYREVVQQFSGRALSADEVFATMNRLAEAAGPEAGGLTADTRFGGTRQDPAVRGAITGIGVDNLHPGQLAHAVVEGMVRELAEMVRRPGMPGIRRVYASGNGVRRNPLVPDAVARHFRAPCVLSTTSEEAAFGAARCAARGLISR